MNAEVVFLIFCSLFAVLLSWLVKKNTWEVIAIWSLFALVMVSPLSAIWLVSISLIVSVTLSIRHYQRYKNYLTLGVSILLTGLLLLFRELPDYLWIGGAYFTLRNLHVIFDGWMEKLINPGFIKHLRYQLFLPTLMAGPINRFEVFERQVNRRRWDESEFFTGAERLLFGMAQVIILGGWLISQVRANTLVNTLIINDFFVIWFSSAIDWIELYFVFAGYSSIALGLALMMGLHLEENFQRPWLAKNLIEFWSRWHITLSQWVRDYVFQPITAWTRLPIIGLTAAMLVIGLWHETSLYYVLWALWQVTGIVLTKSIMYLINKNAIVQKKLVILNILAPIFVLGWLSLANPFITYLLGVKQ